MNEQMPASDGSAAVAEEVIPAAAPTPAETTRQAKRVCIMVLGMHRSGTSSLAGALVKLGAAAPRNLLPAAESNEMGHWESQPLFQFHDELLASAGSRWDDWRSFNQGWYDTPVAAQFKERGTLLLAQEFGDSALFVFKDPRNCRIARFWHDIFAEQGIRPHIVLPVRSPLEVAQSHRTRDGFPIRKGLLLWLRHVLDAEAASRNLPRFIVEWDVFLNDWQASVASMEAVFGAFPANTDLTAVELEKFLRPDLKHQRIAEHELSHSPIVHKWVKQAYAAMKELAREPASRNALTSLDKIKRQFDEASVLFGEALADMETALSAANQQRGEIDRAHREVLAQLQAEQIERNTQTAKLAQLADTRAAEQKTWHQERQALLAEIARIDALYNESEARIRSFEAEGGGAKAENEELRGRVAQLEAQLADTNAGRNRDDEV